MGTGELGATGGNPAMDQHPIQGGVEILIVASCYRNQDKLRPDGPLSSYANVLSLILHVVRITLNLDLVVGGWSRQHHPADDLSYFV